MREWLISTEWVFLYTREAHPGERWPEHQSYEQKVSHARALRDQNSITRVVVVDSLEGATHRDYGLLSNCCVVIDPEGRLAFKADWTNARLVESFLDNLVKAQSEFRSSDRIPMSFAGTILLPMDVPHYVEGLRASGPRALLDLARHLRKKQE